MLSLQYCVFSLLFLYILTGVSCEELTPVKNEEYSLEGSTVTLSYRYSRTITASDDFFWYLQYPGKPPEFLLYISGLNMTRPADSLKSDTKFSTKLSGENHLDLQISSAAVTDSAVYYCARATLSSRRCTTSALCSTIQSIRSAAVKRTILTLNVEHQLVSPVDLNLVVEMEHWLWIILAALFFGVSCEELTPVKNEEYSLEGSTVTLSYRYSKNADGRDQFYWYRQYPGKPPEFLISHSGTEAILNQPIPGLTIKVDQNLINMNISSAAVTDSAVYYCARATLSSRRCTTSALCSTIQSIRSAAVKRTILTLNVEHQLVSPVDLNLVVEMEHWLWIILAALFFGVSCEELTPVKNEEYSLEGSTVTLSYRYSKQATSSDYFYWYRQYPGKPPEFLISHLGSGTKISDPIPGLSFKVSEDKTQMDLQISSAAVTDSAVYYCAVRPTVTGNTKTLYKNIMSKDNTILHNIH
ncbi:hypothetical protein ABVT39_013664 [Epinephelus coioides]